MSRTKRVYSAPQDQFVISSYQGEVGQIVQALISAPVFLHFIAAQLAGADSRGQQTQANCILRLPEVLRRTGLKRSSLYAKIAAGSFPKQLRMSPNMVGWRESEVMAWIANPR